MTSAYNAVWHSINRISQEKVIAHPFPHMEIDDIFPESFYRILQARVPSYTFFENENENVIRLDILNDPAGGGVWSTIFETKAPEKEQRFWADFEEAYFREEFINALLLKFEAFPEEEVYMCGRICVDRLHSGLGPHTDRFDKIVSLIFHIPAKPINHPGCETIILKPKDPNLKPTDEHYKFDEFNEVKRISYRPNKLFCFQVLRDVNGVSSFHGYHQDADVDRRTIKCFIQRDIDPEEVREQVESTKHRSRRWRQEIDNDAST